MTPITDTQADAILTVLSHEYDRNPEPFVRLMEELRILGQADIPKDSLERVWMRVLRERSTAEAAEAGATCPKIAAEGRVCAARPVTPSNPGLRAGTSLPGPRPVSPPDTAPAPVFTAGVGSPSGVPHA